MSKHIHDFIQIKDDKQKFLKGWGFPIKLLCSECGQVRGFDQKHILIQDPKPEKLKIKAEY